MLARTISLYQNAYSGLSRSTWLLSLVMLVNRSGTMVIPYMTLYLTSKGYTIGQAGIVTGIAGLGAVFGGFIGGRLTDRFGFQRVQRITLLGGGLLFIVLGQMNSWLSICICTFLLTLVNESFRPANSTAIAQYSKDENRTRSYSLNRLAVNLGWAVGGGIGGFLASINYHLLFWVDGCTNLVAVLLLQFFLPSQSAAEISHHTTAGKTKAASPYRDTIYLRFIFYVTIFGSCFMQLFSTLPVYYKETLRMPEYVIGMLMTLNGLLITVLEMVLVFKLEGKRENVFYIFYGVTLVGISYVLLNILPLSYFVTFFCMILATLGEICAMPFMNSFWIARTSPGNRGQYAGLYAIAWALATMIGRVAGAEIAEHAGFPILWWIVGGVCALTAIGFWYLRQTKLND